MDFEILKQKLYLLDYPQIHTFDDVQVASLFDKENRIFLLSWVLKKLYNITLTDKNPKRLEILLADHMEENGFCKPSQKLKFVQCALDFPDQILIFNKIFSFMSLPTSENTIVLEQDPHDLLFNDIKSFNDMELNLFPEYGNLKVRSERSAKLLEYQAEIDELTKKLEELDADIKVPYIHSDSSSEDFSKLEEMLKSSVETFQNESANTLCYKGNVTETSFKFSDKFLSSIKENHAIVAMLLQILQCCEALSEFKKRKSTANTQSPSEVNFNLIKGLHLKFSALIALMSEEELSPVLM